MVKDKIEKNLITLLLFTILAFPSLHELPINGLPFDTNSTESGLSFKEYVDFLETKKNETPLGDLISDQFNTSMNGLDELNDDFTIQLDENKIKMLEVYDKIQAAVVLMKVDMLQALNINVDYVDADGD